MRRPTLAVAARGATGTRAPPMQQRGTSAGRPAPLHSPHGGSTARPPRGTSGTSLRGDLFRGCRPGGLRDLAARTIAPRGPLCRSTTVSPLVTDSSGVGHNSSGCTKGSTTAAPKESSKGCGQVGTKGAGRRSRDGIGRGSSKGSRTGGSKGCSSSTCISSSSSSRAQLDARGRPGPVVEPRMA